jgi:chemotaxis signal transduction protein
MIAAPHQTLPIPAASSEAHAPSAQRAIRELLDRPISDEALRENTTWVSQAVDLERRRTTGVLLFQLGNETLGLRASHVARVVVPVPLARVPHKPSEVLLGLACINGEMVVAADLARMLEVPLDGANDVRRQRFLVCGPERDRWALPVTAVHGVTSFDPSTFRAPPITVGQAVIHYAEAIVPVTDDHALEGAQPERGGERLATLLSLELLLGNLRRLLS